MKFQFFLTLLMIHFQIGSNQEVLSNTNFKYPTIPFNHTFVTVEVGLNFHWFYEQSAMIVGIPYGTAQSQSMNMTQALMPTFNQTVYQEFNVGGHITHNTITNYTLTVEYYPPPNQTQSFIKVYIQNLCLLNLVFGLSPTVVRTLQTHCILRSSNYRVMIEGHNFLAPLLDSFKILRVSLMKNTQTRLNPEVKGPKNHKEAKVAPKFHY